MGKVDSPYSRGFHTPAQPWAQRGMMDRPDPAAGRTPVWLRGWRTWKSAGRAGDAVDGLGPKRGNGFFRWAAAFGPAGGEMAKVQ